MAELSKEKQLAEWLRAIEQIMEDTCPYPCRWIIRVGTPERPTGPFVEGIGRTAPPAWWPEEWE